MKILRNVYDWMGTKVHTAWADGWLALLFFIEASFFVIPVDPLLILYCVEKRKKSWYFASLATVASVFGGLFGYLIGAVMWQSVGIKLVAWLISEATFNQVVAKYTLYQNWVVLVAGFTPVPYKAITVSAGFCKLPLIPFIIFSLIGRGARFFLIAGAIRLWGDSIKTFIDRYFNYLVVAFMIILLVSCNVLSS